MTAAPGYTPALYEDVAALFADGTPEPPRPTIGRRSDGHGLIYAAALNIFFGPPESGKTLAASCLAADSLFDDGSVLLIDIDHNGAPATIARFRDFGVSVELLSDPARFRYAAPETAKELLDIVKDTVVWRPALVVLDSIGELLPMFNANSNDADDYTRVNRAVLAALALNGAAVLAIDHEAKGVDSRSYGSSGTAAKKRAVDGAMIRFTVKQPFAPGHGGKAALTIAKDRHGGLRAASPQGEREPIAAMFQLTDTNGVTNWQFWAPAGNETHTDPQASADLADLLALTPPPTNQRDVKARMRWGSDRASAAWNAYQTHVPRSSGTHKNEEPGECSPFLLPIGEEQEHAHKPPERSTPK